MVNRKQFITFLRNEPLIQAEPSIAALKANLFGCRGSIFIGIGLMTSKKLSTGIPFDILALFLEAEAIRKLLKFDKVFLLLGDQHAKSNRLVEENIIDQICESTFNTLTNVVKNLNFTHFEIIKSGDLFKNIEFLQILKSLPSFKNEYLKIEIADLKWFTAKHNVKIKLGWSMENSIDIKGHDERFFDREIIKFCPSLSLIHLKPGRTFDKHRQRVSPYISINGETRILLKPDENVQNKINQGQKLWHDPNFNGAIRHLANIVRAFEKLNGNLPNKTLEEKIQAIIYNALA